MQAGRGGGRGMGLLVVRLGVEQMESWLGVGRGGGGVGGGGVAEECR